ncbi:MAG: UDP-N-acetylglucosamine 2-epimerase (non-hydrolyzing) [Candidatus Marinamargulisbacteria bacterium]|jgi:UDP-N-acetylglucosamine 2-epimerase (non-hydrolysing)
MSAKRVLFIFGTRPEAIKLAPLIQVMKADINFEIHVCISGQHRDMLDPLMSFFQITPDSDLDMMKENQTLFDITSNGLKSVEKIFDSFQPHLVITQGDTSTAFVGALAAFYKKVPVAHIEAGLRTGNNDSPFPEEMNRKLLSQLSAFHFSPTKLAKTNLLKEGIQGDIEIVGNTVIDALFMGLNLIESNPDKYHQKLEEKGIDFGKKIILVTSHRRESFGPPLEEILSAIQEMANTFPDIQIVFPMHPNPNVQIAFQPLKQTRHPAILPVAPLNYPDFIWLMKHSHLILTDSGGIQEEAPALNKPVLVLRKETERIEGIEAGTAQLVGQDKQKIVSTVDALLSDPKKYQEMANAENPFGDGTASQKIFKTLKEKL